MLKFILIPTMIMINKKVNSTITMTMLMVLFNMSLQTTNNAKTSYMFSSDLVSFWITSMVVMISYTLTLVNQTKKEMHLTMVMISTIILLATFNSWNFLTFFVLFEMSMIAILVIIMTWGYQPERTEAMMFMILMTLMFSLPFLVAMMIYKKTLNFWFIEMNMHLMIFISFMFIFMMKMPIYFFHFWLPKVHVEAPIQGSMMLAAILLKLGCYGVMRMNKMLTKFQNFKSLIISMSIISMTILSMNCLMQTDLKTLIAYSSIVHMTLTFTNILMYKSKSMYSSMMIILGHGMCSASLFFSANIMYEYSKSRSMILNKGILVTTPIMMLMWFTSCMNNAPMPPSMNMMAELMCFKNMITWSEKLYLPIVTAAFLSSMFSIYMFYLPTHGQFSKNLLKKKIKTTKDTINILVMVSPMVLIMLKPAMMML